jgi:hypothetical protein
MPEPLAILTSAGLDREPLNLGELDDHFDVFRLAFQSLGKVLGALATGQ